MAFHVGQKVQYTPSFVPSGYEPPPVPQKGCVYTVSESWVCEQNFEKIDLVELPNPDSDDFYPGYFAHNFSPLVEPTTDIATFISLLTPKRERERV